MKLKFNVGDRVFDKKYGHGVVQRVDAGNSEFPYLIKRKSVRNRSRQSLIILSAFFTVTAWQECEYKTDWVLLYGSVAYTLLDIW